MSAETPGIIVGVDVGGTFTDLFWLDGRQWWPYVFPYVTVLAPAERYIVDVLFDSAGVVPIVLRREIYAHDGIDYHSNRREVIAAPQRDTTPTTSSHCAVGTLVRWPIVERCSSESPIAISILMRRTPPGQHCLVRRCMRRSG